MKKFILLLALLSACTAESAYEALHPMKTKVVGNTMECYWQEGYESWEVSSDGRVFPVWVDGHDVCQNQQIKICTQSEESK